MNKWEVTNANHQNARIVLTKAFHKIGWGISDRIRANKWITLSKICSLTQVSYKK